MIYQKSIYTIHQRFLSLLSTTKCLKLDLYYEVIRKAEGDTRSCSREQEKAGWFRPKHLSLLASLNSYSCSKTLKNSNKEQKNPWCYFFKLSFQDILINCALPGERSRQTLNFKIFRLTVR